MLSGILKLNCPGAPPTRSLLRLPGDGDAVANIADAEEGQPSPMFARLCWTARVSGSLVGRTLSQRMGGVAKQAHRVSYPAYGVVQVSQVSQAP